MRAFFGHSRPIAALAAFALLLAALLPALSAAQRSVQADDSPWLVICSAHNPLSSVASRAPVTDDDATATAHCPLCGSAQHAMAPPPDARLAGCARQPSLRAAASLPACRAAALCLGGALLPRPTRAFLS